MSQRYLLCPQCGAHRFFVITASGVQVFFHVDWDGNPFPTDVSSANLSGLDFTKIGCCGCSWQGPLRKLVRFFPWHPDRSNR